MDTKKLLTEGAVFYGLTEGSSAQPTFFVPPAMYNTNAYIPITQEDVYFADLNWETIFEHIWPIELNFFSLTWSERKEMVFEQYEAESITVKEMMYYNVTTLSCMASMTNAVGQELKTLEHGRLTRCGLKSNQGSTASMLLPQRSSARAELRLHEVPTGEPDLWNRLDLRVIRRILVALVGKLSEADAEKFWKWEPGFGYQSDGRITDSQQTITFKATIASSPMEMNAPRVDYDHVSCTAQVYGPRGRAMSAGPGGNMNTPQAKRTNSRARGAKAVGSSRRGESLGPSSSQDGGMPRTSGPPRPFGGDLTESLAAKEEGTQPSHDFCDDIDFTEEDPMVDGADDDDRE
eukprot:212071-Amphidinium_carterae.3